MKRSIYVVVLLALCALFTFSSCQRSSSEMWEDTKTASRHVGRGAKSIGGKHGESRQVDGNLGLARSQQELDYIPLDDGDLYREIALGDPEALEKLNQDSAVPHSEIDPGEMGSQIPGISGFYEATGPKLSMIFRNLPFGYNRYHVSGQENLASIDRIADYLQRNPDVYLFIEGHCDERGAAAYNLALGTRRSSSVRNLLIKQGVNLNRLFTISYGKERPIVMGKGETFWKQNRRVQFKIYQKPVR